MENAEAVQFVTSSPGGWLNTIYNDYDDVLATAKVQEVQLPHNIKSDALIEPILTKRLVWADSGFLNVFRINLDVQNRSAFKDRNSVIISKSAAIKFFGRDDPLGKTIRVSHIWSTMGNEIPLVVSGVFADFKTNSHLHADIIANIEALRSVYGNRFEDYLNGNSLTSSSFSAYLYLKSDTDISKIQNRLNSLATFRDPETDSWLEGTKLKVQIKRIDKLHFDTDFEWELDGQGDIQTLYIIAGIGVFILLIGSINFIGISTSHIDKRFKEIGVRKAFGGQSLQIGLQFLLESSLYVLVSYIISLIFSIFLINQFNAIAGKSFLLSSLFTLDFISIVIFLLIIILILSCIYPSLIMANVKVVNVIKGLSIKDKKGLLLREALIVVQFVILIVMIFLTTVFYLQVDYVQNNKLNELGDQIIAIPYGGLVPNDKLDALKNEISREARMPVVSCNFLPRFKSSFLIEERFSFPGISKEASLILMNADFNFIQFFNIDIIAGRNFDSGNKADLGNFILNEAAVKSLNINISDAVGLEVMNGSGSIGTIIGIVKDFPITSTKNSIDPVIISPQPHFIDVAIYVHVLSDSDQANLTSIKKSWKSILPEVGFDYYFLNDEFKRLYKFEISTMRIVLTISFFALIITLSALYSISLFWVKQRSKEIGVRRVHGATTMSITFLFVKRYSLLFTFAILMAIPSAFYLINDVVLKEHVIKYNLTFSEVVVMTICIYFVCFCIVFFKTLTTSKRITIEVLKND